VIDVDMSMKDSSSTKISVPMAFKASRQSTTSSSLKAAAAFFVHTVTPAPICPGVFGLCGIQPLVWVVLTKL
jgi:hypothetical protein